MDYLTFSVNSLNKLIAEEGHVLILGDTFLRLLRMDLILKVTQLS